MPAGRAVEFDTRTLHAMASADGQPVEILSLVNRRSERFRPSIVGGDRLPHQS